jgi:hypothetical protein
MKRIVKVDSKAVIRDLAVRVRRNEEGVKSFLSRAGIDSGDRVTLADLQQLLHVNPEAFNEMVKFLYGANADGAATAVAATTATAKKGADANTLNFVGNLLGSVVGTAGSTLASIFGQTDQSNVIALQQLQAERQQRMIYVILGVVAVIGVVIAIIAIRNNQTSHVTVAK